MWWGGAWADYVISEGFLIPFVSLSRSKDRTFGRTIQIQVRIGTVSAFDILKNTVSINSSRQWHFLLFLGFMYNPVSGFPLSSVIWLSARAV